MWNDSAREDDLAGFFTYWRTTAVHIERGGVMEPAKERRTNRGQRDINSKTAGVK